MCVRYRNRERASESERDRKWELFRKLWSNRYSYPKDYKATYVTKLGSQKSFQFYKSHWTCNRHQYFFQVNNFYCSYFNCSRRVSDRNGSRQLAPRKHVWKSCLNIVPLRLIKRDWFLSHPKATINFNQAIFSIT
jgi:hypothetical protein